MAHDSEEKRSDRKHRSKDGESSRKRSKHSSTSSKHSSKQGKSREDEPQDEWVEKASTFNPSNLGSNLFGLEDSTDGYGRGEVGDSTATSTGSRGDFFSDLGIEQKRKEIKKGFDPTVRILILVKARISCSECRKRWDNRREN